MMSSESIPLHLDLQLHLHLEQQQQEQQEQNVIDFNVCLNSWNVISLKECV